MITVHVQIIIQAHVHSHDFFKGIRDKKYPMRSQDCLAIISRQINPTKKKSTEKKYSAWNP